MTKPNLKWLLETGGCTLLIILGLVLFYTVTYFLGRVPALIDPSVNCTKGRWPHIFCPAFGFIIIGMVTILVMLSILIVGYGREVVHFCRQVQEEAAEDGYTAVEMETEPTYSSQ